MRISDWSSDVCSSDLVHHAGAEDVGDAQALHALLAGAGHLHQDQLAFDRRALERQVADPLHRHQAVELRLDLLEDLRRAGRSEGRRVGKECGRTCSSRWSPSLSKKQKTTKSQK